MTVLTPPHARKSIIHMLFLMLLFSLYCCANASFTTTEHRCIFDSITEKADPPSTAIVLELPRRKRSGVQLLASSESEWKPIRFRVFTEDLKNNLRYCSAVGQWRPNFKGEGTFCREENILTQKTRNIILNQVLPQATKLHADRLLVEPMTNPIIVPKRIPYICSQFTVPLFHRTKGVENADMVLYVAAGPTRSGTLAWALHCTELKNGRPIVGVINLNPGGVIYQDYFVRVAAHEIAHTLGFNIDFIRRMGMLTELRNLRGKPRVLMVKTLKTREKTRAYYNCPAVPGMELEDEGGAGTAGSHWEIRNAKDELMAGRIGIGYYSALTMALFEDMGFFRANWTMAETMNWGRNSGCRLLTEKCVINGTTTYPDMFCTGNSDEYILSCTSDRLALGDCFIRTHQHLSPWHQYLKDPNHGGSPNGYADLCPVISLYPRTRCTDGDARAMPGSRVGPTSRCLKGNQLHYQRDHIGDVCAEVRCHNDGTVSVRYLGSNAWHLCPEGDHITPKGGFTGGRIMCPKYSEVCYETGRDMSEIDLSPMKVKMSGRQ